MAAPNIVNVTTITGITTAQDLTTTPNAFVSNASASGKVLKINNLIVSNIDGSSAANVYIKYHPQGAAGAGSSVSLAHEISVAADSTLVVMDKASSIYIQENQSLTAYASANGDLAIICSYEDITDD